MSAGAPALLLALGVAGCGALDPVTVSVPRPAPAQPPVSPTPDPPPPVPPPEGVVVDVGSVAVATWTDWYGIVGPFTSATAVGDVDGDGFADWLVNGAEPGDLLYYPSASYTWLLSTNTPTGAVRDVARLIEVTEPGERGRVLGATDDDGDGRSEVIAGSADGFDRLALAASGTGWDVLGTVAATDNTNGPAFGRDFTGDGHPDFAVHAHVFYGPIVGVRAEVDGAPLPITSASAGVTAAPDLDGDGIDDLIVHHASVQLADLAGAPAAPAFGPGAFTGGTWRENPLGDLDGDGYDDLALGGGGTVDLRNATFVVSGPFPTVDTDPIAASAAQVVGDELSDPRSAVPLGDIDGDGYDDAAFAWWDAWYGKVAIAYGPLVGVVEPASLTQIRGETPYDWFGAILSSQDVDNDGWAEVVAGAPNLEHGSSSPAGALYLLGPL